MEKPQSFSWKDFAPKAQFFEAWEHRDGPPIMEGVGSEILMVTPSPITGRREELLLGPKGNKKDGPPKGGREPAPGTCTPKGRFTFPPGPSKKPFRPLKGQKAALILPAGEGGMGLGGSPKTREEACTGKKMGPPKGLGEPQFPPIIKGKKNEFPNPPPKNLVLGKKRAKKKFWV